MMVLFGLAPAHSARASAANHRESISALLPDDLGAADAQSKNRNDGYSCPQCFCVARVGAPPSGKQRVARVRPGALLREQF